MDKYKKAISFYAENNEDVEFGNKNAEHAAVVVAQLFHFAKNEILIYSGTLNGDVTNDTNLNKNVSKYLESGKKFRLILDECPAAENQSTILKKVLNSVKDHTKDVKCIIDEDSSFKESLCNVFSDKQSHHFMVADSVAYRLETDKEKYEAFGNFNDPKIATLLATAFKNALAD